MKRHTNMDFKNSNSRNDRDKEIIFSQAVKAGKRIYYLDVKKSRRDELFLSITESKKIQPQGAEDGFVNFEKHKIFLYKEDFTKFIDALSNAIRYIHENDPLPAAPFGSAPNETSTLIDGDTDNESDADTPSPITDNGNTWDTTTGYAPKDDEELNIIDDIDIKIDF